MFVAIPVRGTPETLPLDGEIDRTVGESLGPEFQILAMFQLFLPRKISKCVLGNSFEAQGS